MFFLQERKCGLPKKVVSLLPCHLLHNHKVQNFIYTQIDIYESKTDSLVQIEIEKMFCIFPHEILALKTFQKYL